MKKIILLFLFFGLLTGCADSKKENENLVEVEDSNLKSTTKKQMMTSLTFQDGNAENAMNFYVELFDNSKIINIDRWGENAPVEEGTIMQGTFELNGNLFMCSDSPPVHNWDFTPAVSIYVECESEEEIEKYYSKLSENGDQAMPLDNYGFSQKFAWVIDQFGVSWQLNLE